MRHGPAVLPSALVIARPLPALPPRSEQFPHPKMLCCASDQTQRAIRYIYSLRVYSFTLYPPQLLGVLRIGPQAQYVTSIRDKAGYVTSVRYVYSLQ